MRIARRHPEIVGLTLHVLWNAERKVMAFLLVSVFVTGAVFSQDIASKNPTVNIFTVSNTLSSGAGSLRQAIEDANAISNFDPFTPDNIDFAIPGAGPHTIQPFSPLPNITESVIIDGFTQPGSIPDTNGPGQPFNGVLQIVLDGSLLASGSGLVVVTDQTFIHGLVINNFYHDGVAFVGVGSFLNTITGCFIGTDVTGTIALGNGRTSGGESLGVRIGSGASDNTIQRNVISGNIQSGLSIDNNGNFNTVFDNAIGTDPTGTFAVPNGGSGMHVQSGAFSNQIIGNLISGNAASGISSFGGANSNLYDDNTVGTNLAGSLAIPNQHNGLSIFGDNGDVITNNLISGNLLDGIVSSEPGLIITDNLIGPDETGTQFIGNQVSALRLTSGGHLIERNILAGSGNAGIGLRGAFSNVIIRNNAIGTDATGSIMIGQFRKGILIEIGPQSNILIDSNIVAGSEAKGIEVDGINISGVTITQNSVFENGSLGIDLRSGAIALDFTPNDPGDADLGTNNLQNFPDIERAEINGSGNLTFDFLVDSDPGNSTYPLVVEFFIADADNQEGQTYLGTGAYLVGEAGNLTSIVLGNAVALGVIDTSQFVATATDAAGNTSEFSLPASLVTTDLLALEALYNATDGANWTDNTNWMTSAPIETWFGLIVVDGQVTELDLSNNNLSGSIPPALGNLLALQYFRLDNNNLSGTIPIELTDLSNLISINLASNQLTDTIPISFSNIPNLVNLLLNDNQLTGIIPTELGSSPNLLFLWLQDNQLTGSIPAELGNLSRIESLILGGNPITGVIPPELAGLSTLKYLGLFRSQLDGGVPIELGNLTNLLTLQLHQNLLSGTIPSEFGNLVNLTLLRLDGNQFTGSVPNSFSNLVLLESLLLHTNELDDLPDLSVLTELTLFDVWNNQFTFEDLERCL